MLPFVCLPTRITIDPAVSDRGLRIFTLLATYANRDGWCWPTLRTLGAQLGIDRTTVCHHINHLVKLRHLDKAKMQRADGVTVTAYRPLLDLTKKASRKALKAAPTRITPSNDRCAQRNTRCATDPLTVAPSATMEVDTTKKKEPEAPGRPREAPDAPLRPWREIVAELGFQKPPTPHA